MLSKLRLLLFAGPTEVAPVNSMALVHSASPSVKPEDKRNVSVVNPMSV